MRFLGRAVKSLWDDAEAKKHAGLLGERVYTSRLLGRDPSLVLHGGGNTSVKIPEKDLLGREEMILWVKGSGWDLETIQEAGFSPVRMPHLLELAKLPALSDAQMVSELRTHMTRASAPTPSVEAILHAILPHTYVDHTHADAVIALTSSAPDDIRAVWGDEVVVIPYVMPGFDLARVCAERFPREAGPRTIGMVLVSHGIFSFGATAKESYERMIALVTKAELHLVKRNAWSVPLEPALDASMRRIEIAELRRDISRAAGAPMIVSTSSDRGRAFARHPKIAEISQRGPATPDHVIRTKRVPMLGRDIAAFEAAYRAYFDAHAKPHHTMLDPAPRVVLDRDLGLLTIGRTAKDAGIAADIWDHTIDVILSGEALGGWRALSEKDLFDVEYWELEQAKLKSGPKPAVFSGEIALVTGAASGIGKACVDSFLSRGAAVVGLDVDPAIERLHARPDFRGVVCDVTDEKRLVASLEVAARAFGGLDMLVLNAGIFPATKRIADLATADFDRTMRINTDASVALLREAHPLLARSCRGGRVVVIGSKNVRAPGPGAAAYSASKAALAQIARVAALEWGADRIRVNSIHPNAVFDTALWTPEILAERAKQYGMSIEDYKKKNVLGVEVTSKDVAELAAEMCGPLFAKTTGANVPVDGGNDRVI
jgi:rhamnose utilization protein RhaD (predicted bifunctional aldolase and dehydrogenase)/NAD(P)-dependent dehydrogenase (short-subunit alcohol dehydrogenase family)